MVLQCLKAVLWLVACLVIGVFCFAIPLAITAAAAGRFGVSMQVVGSIVAGVALIAISVLIGACVISLWKDR